MHAAAPAPGVPALPQPPRARRSRPASWSTSILDNYASHKHPKVRAWLDRHPRWTFHFTPTSASWLNAVEGFFAKLTKRRLKRGVFHSLVDLQAAINRYLAEHNQAPNPSSGPPTPTRSSPPPSEGTKRWIRSTSQPRSCPGQARRVVAKVEWHQGELYPRVGFIVTNLTRPAEGVSKFYDARGSAGQWIREGKYALRWTRLSCHSFRHNAVRLQLHALAYNLANFVRSLALPEEAEHWSLTTLREKPVKIGAGIVRHGRYVVFQLAEAAVPRALFTAILRRTDRLRPRPLVT